MFNFGFNLGRPSGSTAVAQILYDMNITDVAGTDYLLNQGATGATNDAIVLNATQDGIGSILVDGTTDIDTGFKPNLPVYSTEETVTGELEDLIDGVGQGTFSQRTEQRLLTHEGNIFGDELVANGTFETDTTGWIPQSATLSVDSERLKVLASSTYGRGYYRNIDTEIGNTYSFSIDIIEGDDTSFICRVAKSSSGNEYYDSGLFATDYGTHSGTFVAETLTTYVVLFSTTSGKYTLFDNVSVKKVLPDENKYYIDGVEQSSVPALPDPDTTINLNDTAVIGYPDTIDSREANFEVWDEIKTATDALDSYNQWVLNTQDALTDGEGAYLTDEHGRYLYA